MLLVLGTAVAYGTVAGLAHSSRGMHAAAFHAALSGIATRAVGATLTCLLWQALARLEVTSSASRGRTSADLEEVRGDPRGGMSACAFRCLLEVDALLQFHRYWPRHLARTRHHGRTSRHRWNAPSVGMNRLASRTAAWSGTRPDSGVSGRCCRR
jgi:hypothetical protein